ncbi:redox-sensitive transcriptional activator SoxR [Streptosporangium sp. NPDC000239]|uniref:Redox-sensitive transcriptional activator SoxR n=1 Tax=Streptosporangium jomthongense TaxID=1193683 RepID=A0ABV8FEY1_9ACTN
MGYRRAVELTVGELSRRSGVATSTLRFYERKQLIVSRRTAGNQRRYSRDTLRRVAFIRASQQLGTSLAEIGFYLSLLPEGRTPTREDWAKLSECYQKDLNGRIQRLEWLRDRLAGCIGCGCLSLGLCKLVNPDDCLGENASGARKLYEP